jgi:ribosome-associated protein
MDDTLLSENRSLAIALGKLLEEHKGGDVVVMDMKNLNFWTDYFIITTVTSNTHLMGLERHIKEFARDKGIEILRRSRKPDKNAGPGSLISSGSVEPPSDEWSLIDLGDIVIHLMSARTRSFFELERLWSAASLVYRTGE